MRDTDLYAWMSAYHAVIQEEIERDEEIRQAKLRADLNRERNAHARAEEKAMALELAKRMDNA